MAELCEGGAAGLSPRLAHRVADRRACRSPARSAGRCWPGCGARDRDLLRRMIGVAAPGIAASLLLLWQTRTGPAAQMLAAVGAAALVWFLVPLIWHSKHAAGAGRRRGRRRHRRRGRDRAVGRSTSFPERSRPPRRAAIGRANSLCASLWGLHPVALQPKGMVFTFVDLGPRLITRHPSRRDRRPLSSQRSADRRRDERLARERRPGAPASSRQISFQLCAELPEQLDDDDLHVGGAEGLLRADCSAERCRTGSRPCQLPKDSPFKMWRVVG